MSSPDSQSIHFRRQSWVMAGFVSVLTLGVFSAAQSIGPESAVRRWMQAVWSRDLGALQLMTAEDIRSPSAAQMVHLVAQFPPDGRWNLVEKRVEGRRALVVTEHRFPNSPSVTIPWVLVRTGAQWRIDPDGTHDLIRSNFVTPLGPQ